jgi:hypothetical protein
MDDKIYYAGGRAQKDALREAYVHGEYPIHSAFFILFLSSSFFFSQNFRRQ